ncbi:MAG: zinc ribbon domain-containing protein, partial [Mailhella sp.]|nr:zinc ribbon domain-containing protein [Mailhella sp.]
DLFDQVQAKLNTVAHAPAAAKAQVEYMLRGKAFCGHCGAPMVGESGRGKGGAIYNYYACANRKKLHTCKKKNERKESVEFWIVQKTVNYILAPENLSEVSRAVVAEYNREFSSGKVAEMECELNRIERELNNLVDSLAEAPKITHKRIYEKMESLENQKADLEEDLVKQKIACGIRYTEEEVRAWIKDFCDGDINDEAYRRKIIERLVNTVFLYDDFAVIFYNFPGGKTTVSYSDMLSSLQSANTPSSECSDLNRPLLPNESSVSQKTGCFLYAVLPMRCTFLQRRRRIDARIYGA